MKLFNLIFALVMLMTMSLSAQQDTIKTMDIPESHYINTSKDSCMSILNKLESDSLLVVSATDTLVEFDTRIGIQQLRFDTIGTCVFHGIKTTKDHYPDVVDKLNNDSFYHPRFHNAWYRRDGEDILYTIAIIDTGDDIMFYFTLK